MKALKKKSKGKYKPNATPSTTIFRKGNSSQDDLTLLSVNSAGDQSIQSDQFQSTLDRKEDSEVCVGPEEGGGVYGSRCVLCQSERWHTAGSVECAVYDWCCVCEHECNAVLSKVHVRVHVTQSAYIKLIRSLTFTVASYH